MRLHSTGRATDTLWILAAGSLAVLGGWAVGTPYKAVLPAILGLFVLLLFSSRAKFRPYVLYTAGVLAILASGAAILEGSSGAASLITRLVGAALIVVSAFSGGAGLTETGRHASERALRRWLPAVVLSLLTYLIFATALHAQWVNFSTYTSGLVLLVLVIYISATRLPAHVVLISIIIAIAITALASLAAAVLDPTTAIVQSRLRGVLNNANLLGFFAFILGSLSLVGVRSRRVMAGLFVLAVVIIAMTGSRASALALGIVLVGLFFVRRSTRNVLIGSALLLLAFILLIAFPEIWLAFETLLRGNNSRQSALDVALYHFGTSPTVGVGMDGEDSIIASSPLRAIAHAGIGGIVAIAGLWLVFTVRGAQTAGSLGIFSLAAVVHSVFEGWLLSPIGPMLMIFVLGWWSASEVLKQNHQTDPALTDSANADTLAAHGR